MKAPSLVVSDKKIFESCIMKTYFIVYGSSTFVSIHFDMDAVAGCDTNYHMFGVSIGAHMRLFRCDHELVLTRKSIKRNICIK